MNIRSQTATSVARQGGFTLIELMITIAILAILVALAVPAYKDYTIRSKVAECINGAAVAKVQVSEYRQSLGAWPPSAGDAAIDGNSGVSRFCDGFVSYDSGSGAFSIDINESEVDPSVTGSIQPTLTPTMANSGFVNWRCTQGGTSPANYKYLPAPCRGT